MTGVGVPTEPSTVPIVDDHVREGLCRLLTSYDDMRVVSEAGGLAVT
jgi:hypothetical protein